MGKKVWKFQTISASKGWKSKKILKLRNLKVCLHFQLFVYFFVSWLFTFVSCLFTLWIFAPKSLVFHQSFVKIMLQSLTYVSSLFTFSAVCLLFRQLIVYFCQLISAVCLLLVSWFLNFCAKIMFFWSLFCHYRCFNTLIVNWKNFIWTMFWPPMAPLDSMFLLRIEPETKKNQSTINPLIA